MALAGMALDTKIVGSTVPGPLAVLGGLANAASQVFFVVSWIVVCRPVDGDEEKPAHRVEPASKS